MSDELTELPEGWIRTTLGEAFCVYVGATPSRKVQEYWEGSIPWVSSGEVAFCEIKETRETITELGLQNTSTELHPPGTVLLGMIGEGKTRGQAAIIRIYASHNQNSAAIRVSETGMPPEYTYHFLELEYERTRQIGSGNNQPALNKSRVQSMSFPLAPLNEQKRIVAKIEELRDRLHRSKQSLEAIPELCDRFRQSVLAAAFRGDLTADWREENPGVEPASVLLERIRSDRRQKWEEMELEKFELTGKRPKDEKWKTKYVELEPIDDSDLPELPETWCWVAAEEIVEPSADIVYGIVQPGPHVPDGIPYVRGKDIQDGQILLNQLLRTSPDIADRYARASLRGGDILLGIIRATKVVIVPEELTGGNITQGTARFRPSGVITTDYLANWLDSPYAQEWLHAHYRGIDMPGLNLRDVRRLPIPLAPIEEQRELSQKLSIFQNHRTTIQQSFISATEQLSLLNQGILAKAFRGELVEQDPNDEPASVLLDRIRAERQTQESKKSGGAKGKRKKASSDQLDLPGVE